MREKKTQSCFNPGANPQKASRFVSRKNAEPINDVDVRRDVQALAHTYTGQLGTISPGASKSAFHVVAAAAAADRECSGLGGIFRRKAESSHEPVVYHTVSCPN